MNKSNKWQPLFDYLHELGIIAIESEMQEIVQIVNNLKNHVMTKQEKQAFLEAGGAFIRRQPDILIIKAKTKDKDWHYLIKCDTKKQMDQDFEDLLKMDNFKTY